MLSARLLQLGDLEALVMLYFVLTDIIRTPSDLSNVKIQTWLLFDLARLFVKFSNLILRELIEIAFLVARLKF